MPRWARVLDAPRDRVAAALLRHPCRRRIPSACWSRPPVSSVMAAAMAIAVALLAARHWRLPRPTVLGRLALSYRRITSSASWSDAWGIFVATRVAVFLVGLMAVFTIGIPDNELRFRVSENEALNLPVRWDAGWYLNITTGGYRWSRRLEEHKYQNIAFFPGFPIAIYLVGRLFGGAINAHVAAGVLISHLAFLWALVYLYRLARDLTGDAHRAGIAAAHRHLPVCSLLRRDLHRVALSSRSGRRDLRVQRAQRWSRVVAWGVMIGLTRPNGFMLALTLGALAMHRACGRARTWRCGPRSFRWRQPPARFLAWPCSPPTSAC